MGTLFKKVAEKYKNRYLKKEKRKPD